MLRTEVFLASHALSFRVCILCLMALPRPTPTPAIPPVIDDVVVLFRSLDHSKAVVGDRPDIPEGRQGPGHQLHPPHSMHVRHVAADVVLIFGGLGLKDKIDQLPALKVASYRRRLLKYS
jgi:hypothetical protein